jgi:hypothetical protein
MGIPVHKILEEFASEEPNQPAATVHPLRLRVTPPPSAQPAQPAPAVPDSSIGRMAEAYAKGYEEGRSVAQAEARAELAAVEAGHREQLEQTMAQFSERLADELSAGLGRQMAHLNATLSDQTVSALLPVLRHALTEASIRELADGLAMLTREAGAVTVELSGPQQLVDRVWQLYREREKLEPNEGPQVRFRIDESAELRVSADETLIESRLMEWMARIAEAVG